MPSVNGYVAFFDVSVSPSNSDEDDEDDDDEGEEKEEKRDEDEERLVAFRLYHFFSRTVPPLLRPSPTSLCTLFSYSFISFLLRCSMNEVSRGYILYPGACILSPRLSLQTATARLSLFPDV